MLVDRLPKFRMKTLVIRIGLILISLIVCASIIKFSYRNNKSLPLPNKETFTWRAPQYLSYWWVRLTNPPEYGSLRWRVQEAKRSGERQVEIITISCGTVLSNPQEALKEALSYFAVIVAEPIEKKSYADKHNVVTWYRFRIIETLNPRPLAPCPGCSGSFDPPSDLLPIGNDEILILQGGGTIIIDGVKVVHHYSNQPYSLFQKYLLLLRPDSTKRTGVAGLGSSGLFTVDSEGILKRTTLHHSALSMYIHNNHQNSLDRLKSDIQRLERQINRRR
ncbi:MAG: hypothetical protein L0220_19040 [Acidobacteria bacterium]|nr:hypothetical protein [Acidobacteriota bacterium]